ncbi:putative F-box/kelch-repeat protein [Raphanus sativus]|nr:putative F-box/kelch-repeat protein [Raphanus sativus]
MTNNPIAPPRKKNKKTKSPSLSSIPDDVIVNVLARISKSHYRSLCLVSKNFNSLLSSPDIYFARSLIGNIEARLYVGLWLPNPSSYHSWSTLHFPVHSEIYQIGGSNEDKRTRAVRVLDCRSHTWRRAPDMKVARKHARSYFLDEKIYVIGGCTETKKYLTSRGEVFDLKTQTWKPLPKPPSDDDVQLYKSVVCGGRLYAFTMNNNNKNYAYDPNEERWVQEAGFVGLGRINGPWCVIGSAIFAERDRTFMWCDPRNGKWSVVYGLYHIYLERANNYRTVQLVNHDGKLVIIWHQWNWRYKEYTSIWCAVISLEERLSPSSDLWGKVERCNVVLGSVHTSVKLSRCLSVSV